jgi:Bacterial Ig domain
VTRHSRPGVLLGAVLAALVALPLPAAAIVRPGLAALPIDLLPPVGVADTLTMVHDRVAVVPAPGVLGNDLDLDGGATAVLDAPPSHGTLTLRADGGYTYKPDAGYVGVDRFRYHATSLLLDSLTTPVTITVTNVLPVAVDDVYQVKSGQVLVVAGPGVMKNDVDADGDQLSAELRSGVSNGSIDFQSNGGFTFDPGGGFSGATSFNYRLWDGAAWSLEATAVITVLPDPTPLPTPIPTVLPTPLPTILPTPLPTILPTPRPTATPRPTPTPRPTTAPTPTPASTPTTVATPPPTTRPDPTDSRPTPPTTAVGGGPVSTGGPGPGGPAPGEGPFALPPVRFDPFDASIGGFGAFGGFEWVVPALVLTAPGLLLIVALIAQALIGIVWLPMVRRHMAGVGLRRRRREAARS